MLEHWHSLKAFVAHTARPVWKVKPVFQLYMKVFCNCQAHVEKLQEIVCIQRKRFLGAPEHQISRHVLTIVVLWAVADWSGPVKAGIPWQQAGTCPGLSEWNVALMSAQSKVYPVMDRASCGLWRSNSHWDTDRLRSASGLLLGPGSISWIVAARFSVDGEDQRVFRPSFVILQWWKNYSIQYNVKNSLLLVKVLHLNSNYSTIIYSHSTEKNRCNSILYYKRYWCINVLSFISEGATIVSILYTVSSLSLVFLNSGVSPL